MPIYSLLYYLLLVSVSGGFVTYVYFCIRFYFGYKNYKAEKSFHKKTVSVIIVARNEAHNLRKLLLNLVNQSYPKDMYEVIVSDDGSEDDTEELLAQYSDNEVNVRYIKVLGRETAFSPKKQALEKAVLSSTGQIILTTDADCLVPATWIERMVASFTPEVSMVAGYSRTLLKDWKQESILHKYEHFDFTATYMVLGGGYTIGRSWACIGQNLAYTRAAFEDVGGFDQIRHLLSGDDVNLMQTMRRKGHKIIFNFDPKSFVYTYPVKSWKQLLNQRSRWASNMKYQLHFDPEFFFILLSMGMMYWGGVLMFIFNWKLALGILIFRWIVENTFLAYARRRFGVSNEMAWFYPIWFLIQTFFLSFTMVLGQFDLFSWHGKKPYRRSTSNETATI